MPSIKSFGQKYPTNDKRRIPNEDIFFIHIIIWAEDRLHINIKVFVMRETLCSNTLDCDLN